MRETAKPFSRISAYIWAQLFQSAVRFHSRSPVCPSSDRYKAVAAVFTPRTIPPFLIFMQPKQGSQGPIAISGSMREGGFFSIRQVENKMIACGWGPSARHKGSDIRESFRKRMLWNGSSELLVQQLKEVAYSFERLRIAIADIDHSIAIALQRLRSRFAKPTREERRRNSSGPTSSLIMPRPLQSSLSLAAASLML
jgi:hypothetical protein